MIDILYLPRIGHYNLPWARALCAEKTSLHLITHSTSWVDPENAKLVNFTSKEDEKYFLVVNKVQLFLTILSSRGLFLIHGYGGSYELLLIIVAKLRGRRVVVRGEFTPRRTGRFQNVKNLVKKVVTNFVDGFLPISSEGAYFLTEELRYGGRVTVLPYIVDEQLLSEIRIPKRRKYDFVFVGKLIERKGLKTFLSALVSLQRCSECSVAIVGDGPLRNQVESFASENLSVDYFGFLEPKECYEVIANSRVLVLPSTFETWGLVVNEALMLGCNVVGSDEVGAMIELAPFSDKLFVFKSGDCNSLSVQCSAAKNLSNDVWMPETAIGLYCKQNHNDRIIRLLEEL